MALFSRDTDGTLTETLYVGAVLGTTERNGYHDSYWFALVWDDAEGVKKIETGSTAYYGGLGVTVDATPEVRAKAVEWETARQIRETTKGALSRIEEGTEVRSLTTRGKNKGVVGVVQQIKDSNYGPGKRVHVTTEDNAWGWWLDLARVAPTRTELTPEEVDQVARAARRQAYGMYGKK